jgi:hypothetical protein
MAIAAIDAELRNVMRVAEGDGLRGRCADAGDVVRGHDPADGQKSSYSANRNRGEHQPKNGIGAATKELRHINDPLDGRGALFLRNGPELGMVPLFGENL